VKEVVIDIETVSRWSELSDSQRAHLQKLHDASAGETAADKAALSPHSGRVIVIGVRDPDAGSGAVFYEGAGAEHGEDGYRFVPCADERTLLARFWSSVQSAHRVVGWNSFSFDVPFLVSRSLVHGVRPRWDWASKWYEPRAHMDLKEALGVHGRARCYNLDYTTQEHGLASPKGDLSGAKVGEAYRRGETLRIARYCAADVTATSALYLKVRDFLPAGGR
jgi:DNA polymerase elongation subunit (family B)